jgi:MoxR-like ATPase
MLENTDRRDGEIYVFRDDDPLKVAIQVARATDRPLLLRGAPGVGKSSIAAYVARDNNWRYYEKTVTARTEATDLLWTFDAVKKFGDALQLPHREADAALDDGDYVEPGAIWWAFDRDGARSSRPETSRAGPPREPFAEVNRDRDAAGAVVLIDELDKADPDIPNAVLVPLGSREFEVTDTGDRVEQKTPSVLIIITTNEERDLPPAFVRRCVVHTLETPEPKVLVEIAKAHAKHRKHSFSAAQLKLVHEIADLIQSLQVAATASRSRPPGVAEFLDTVWAVIDLEVATTADHRWKYVKGMTLTKEGPMP